jgi:hypothetical protein
MHQANLEVLLSRKKEVLEFQDNWIMGVGKRRKTMVREWGS